MGADSSSSHGELDADPNRLHGADSCSGSRSVRLATENIVTAAVTFADGENDDQMTAW